MHVTTEARPAVAAVAAAPVTISSGSLAVSADLPLIALYWRDGSSTEIKNPTAKNLASLVVRRMA